MIGVWNGKPCRCTCLERAEVIIHFESARPDHPVCLGCFAVGYWDNVQWLEPLDDEAFESWRTVGKVMES